MAVIKATLFLVIIVGVAIYFFTHPPQIFQSFPQEKIPSTNPVLTYNVQYAPPSLPSASFLINPPSSIVTSKEPAQIPDYLIPAGFTRAQLSPYFQKIRISSAYASYYSNYPSQFRLYAYLSNGEKINITGWDMKTNHGGFTVPQAINVYAPSGFYGLSSEGDIVVSGSSNIDIYTNRSPVNANFRLNKCTGYLANNHSFNPPISQNCPTVPRSDVSYLSGQCQSYIFSLGSCKEPSIAIYNSFPGNDEGNACRRFLSNINQLACFRKHSGDADFLSNEWRIWINWTGINNILDSQHDAVRLFDKNGLLVDQYIY